MSNQTEMTVLDELARAITERGGSRADFAKAVGIGQVYLSQILNGKRPLSRLPMETGRKISQISGIPMERLTGDDAPALAPDEAAE